MSKAIETTVNVGAPLAESEAEVTDLAVTEQAPMDIKISSFSARPDFSPEDVLMSRLRLAQGLTAEVQAGVAHPGEWVFTGLPAMKTVTIIPLAMMKANRRTAYFIDKTIATICNNHIGAPDVDCPECRTGQVPDLTTKAWNPGVAPYYQYMIYMPQYKMPGTLEFASKSSQNAAKQMNIYLLSQGFGHVAFELGSAPAKNNLGSWQTPTVTVTQVDPEVLQEAISYLPTTLQEQIS
jgi:hypothetical protein